MIRTRGLKCSSIGAILLLLFWYSGAIGHLLKIPGVDWARYPYDTTHYPYVTVHWPLQVLLFAGLLLFPGGLLLFVFDLFRGNRPKGE
jgi:hypothetical protein